MEVLAATTAERQVSVRDIYLKMSDVLRALIAHRQRKDRTWRGQAAPDICRDLESIEKATGAGPVRGRTNLKVWT